MDIKTAIEHLRNIGATLPEYLAEVDDLCSAIEELNGDKQAVYQHCLCRHDELHEQAEDLWFDGEDEEAEALQIRASAISDFIFHTSL